MRLAHLGHCFWASIAGEILHDEISFNCFYVPSSHNHTSPVHTFGARPLGTTKTLQELRILLCPNLRRRGWFYLAAGFSFMRAAFFITFKGF
jgi:hypothetical protein